MSIQSATIVGTENYQYDNVGRKAFPSESVQTGNLITTDSHFGTIQTQHTSKEHSIAEKQILRSIERVMKAMQGPNTSLEMKIHDKTNQVIVKVLDKETGDIIREIPPEKMQDIVAEMIEIAGLLVDKRV